MTVRIESQAEPIPGYKLLGRLGSGGFGEVWKAEAPGGIFKAIKIIHGDLRSRDNDMIRYAEQELKALKRVKMVRHPYLLAMDRYDIVEGRLMIVMELADCNLWDRFRVCRDKGMVGIPREELLMYMSEAAEVLDMMNDEFQLQHLDIKPQNLFVLYNHVKVADFGQVKDLEGVMASVTGGITPVYAAPETFDGMVSRFCDQYSLACVYQELLTGVRPFDGSSMSQLLMQHIQLPPNLEPSPYPDRQVLLRALAKKPDERWPNVSTFVRALREAGNPSGTPARYGPDASSGNGAAPCPLPSVISMGVAGPGDTPAPRSIVETAPPIHTPAPPEFHGPGPLQPTLVVGLGQSGLRIVQRFRYELEARYGSTAHTPAIRSFFVDTDPETLEDAQLARPLERLAGLPAADVVEARLNRSAHYMKPRMNGRSLTDGWFDPQLLYKIPRNPTTMGYRLFGRLAFCDHFRTIVSKVQAELDACLAHDALESTATRTGLECRTNRPRVFVVAGLGGGTGGGMFLDLAFAVRTRLKRMGYESPEVIGLLLIPPADAALTPPQLLGNTYAALTELNHYSRRETTFSAHYDERNGVVREKDTPFARFYLMPSIAGSGTIRATPPNVGPYAPRGSGALAQPNGRGAGAAQGGRTRLPSLTPTTIGMPGSRILAATGSERSVDAAAGLSALKTFSDAAEFLRLNLFTSVGRLADESRASREADHPRPTVGIGAFGLMVFDWPRGDVVARTAVPVTAKLLEAWVGPNARRAREVVPDWAAQHWTRLGLDPDTLLGTLQDAAEGCLGCRVDDLIASTTDPLVPKGWLARLPESDKVAVLVDKLDRTFGPPGAGAKRTPTPLETAMDRQALTAAQNAQNEMQLIGPGLVEDPEFRLGGTEDVLRQFLATLDRLLERYGTQASELDARAATSHELLLEYGHYQRGARKPSVAEFSEAVRQYPRCRFQGAAARRVVEVYQYLRDGLANQLAEVAGCRQRLETAAAALEPAVPDELLEVAVTVRRLMPPACTTIADAVERFLGVLVEDDYRRLDALVQAAVEPELGGVFQTCLNSVTGAERIVALVVQEARAYLETRLGAVDLAAMFAERYRTPQAAELAISEAYRAAGPDWVGAGPWTAAEFAVLAAPGGEAGRGLREIAARGIPVAGLPIAETRDELTVYREYPTVPLSALPHLGPAGANAYQTLPDANQCTLHSRLDVTHWTDIDAE